MKNFFTVLKYEFNQFFKNKMFIGITLFLVLLIAAVMFFPRLSEALKRDEKEIPQERPIMLVKADETLQEAMQQAFAATFPEYEVQSTQADTATIKEKIAGGEAECAFVTTDAIYYTYYVDTVFAFDTNATIAETVLQQLNQSSAMVAGGLDPQQVDAIMNTQVVIEVENLSKEQLKNLPYADIMIFALYMVISIYGQMVASNVASEKSSRAMELLVTSAKTTDLMFGKIMAACLAGLMQLAAVFGSAILCYNLNEKYWCDNALISSIFQIPPQLLVYMLVFFIFGYLIYAFLYGAIGSMASKTEDINTMTLPPMLVIMAAYLIIETELATGNVDSVVMKICSYIPFTSPMAMFARICVGSVATYEIVLSVGILAVSVALIGILAAKIYSVGVLLYGKTPRLGTVLKAITNKI